MQEERQEDGVGFFQNRIVPAISTSFQVSVDWVM
jgi:hypothetical protein